MKFSKKLQSLLEKLDLDIYSFVEDDYEDEIRKKIEDSFGKFEIIVSGRGSVDGEPDYYDEIFYFSDKNVYLKIKGYYSSWDGTDWSAASFEEVEPYEVTVTKYRKKKK